MNASGSVLQPVDDGLAQVDLPSRNQRPTSSEELGGTGHVVGDDEAAGVRRLPT